MKWLSFFVIAFLLLSCDSYSEKELEQFDKKIQDYLDSTKISMEKTEDGLYYSIINEGTGEEYIGYNDQVTFYYKGSFLDGNAFQVIDKNDPLKHTVNQLIVGWQEALMMLRNGGEILIIVPPHLGYRKKKTKLIPKDSILIYRLVVLNVE